MTDVFYDPLNRQITIAVPTLIDVNMLEEEDGSTLFSFENVDTIEFYWPEDRLWRAVD